MSVVERSSAHRRLRTLAAVLTGAALAGVLALGGTPTPAAADPAAVAVADPTTVTTDGLPTWQINGVVWSQAVVGNTVYVTGSFSKARPPGVAVGGPGEINAANIFAFDITTGNPVSFNHALNAQGLVIRASPDSQRLYVGGDFTTVDGKVRQHVAAFNLSTGALIDDFAPSTDGQVRGFGFTGSTVYVGGNFRAANSQPRRSLAAFSVDRAALLPWNPTVDTGFVWSMVMAPNGSRVIVGGSFTTLNTVAAYGSGALNAQTGATEAWAANARLRAAGDKGAITSLNSDGTQIYGSGYSFGAGAQFEGTFAADPNTGAINWVNDCLGDTYDVFPIGQVLYNVSHRHDCSNIGAFGDTVPRSRWIKASADRTYPVGTLTKKDAYGWDFTGLPYSGILHWYPELKFGTYTSSGQAAWSVTGNADYVVLGGEFPTVNNVPQQGLVRFTKRPNGPHAKGPINNAAFAPTPYSAESGTVRVPFSSVYDRDDTLVTYDVYRSQLTGNPGTWSSGSKFATLTRSDSELWNLPSLSVTDTGRTPGSKLRYQVRATDPDGNFQWSAWSTQAVVSAAAPSSYATGVRQRGATHLWRLNEPSGTLYDSIGDLPALTTGTTYGTAGALTREANPSVTTTAAAKVYTKDVVAADSAVTVEAWVKTTSTRGGRIVGFGDAPAITSTSTDRVLYLDASGRVNFVIGDGGYRTVFSRYGINDGQWHHVAGMVDGGGIQLFVDGQRVGRDQNYTNPKLYAGYWRIGSDQTNGFLNKPLDSGLAGSIDEVAVYPKALTKAEVQANYTASGRAGTWGSTPTDAYGADVAGDNPDLYWRLGEPSGNAVDSSASGALGNVSGGVTRGQSGAVAGNSATAFNGSTGLVAANQSWTTPKFYSAELWFKTTTTTGGKLIGFGSAPTGLSNSYDRHVYMYNNGKLSFGSLSTANSVVTGNAYNDGQWHHVVASQGADGMRLWVDAQLVGSNPQATGASYLGYWRVGGDRTWGSATSNYLSGTLDEVAVYPRVLAEQDVRAHYVASGRVAVNRPPVASFALQTDKTKLTVDGTGSTDPDGPVSYAWDFGDGQSATGATATHNYAAAGTYEVRLTVTDGPGLTSSATKSATPVQNQAPVAAFTAETTFLKATLDARGSSDPDGTIESYAWDFGDQESGTGATPSHAYDRAGTYSITLTTTDDDGATNTVARQVTVVQAPNELPKAAFAAETRNLDVTFDAGDSADPDGTVASYAWVFGDGATGSGEDAEHTYATAGTFPVRLTVTDNRGGTDTVTHDVTVTVNQGPTAEFASEVVDQIVSFDAGDSTDPDGSVESYAWNFGDGTGGTGKTTEHPYAAPGSYTVTLTVTDDDGATDSVTHPVTAVAPAVYAEDGFGRSVGNGWGTADRGGAWNIPSGAAKFSVSNGVGRVSLTSGAATATLPSVGSTDLETTVSVAVDKPATGGGQYVGVIGRQVSGAGDYRAKVRIATGGAVSVILVKMVGSTETTLASANVPGLTYGVGESLTIKVNVSGTGSTAVKAKVWKGAGSEPQNWVVSATDNTAALQAPGSVGLYSYLSGSTTNGPVAFSYDRLLVARSQ